MKIGRMVLGQCQTNCYFVYCEESKKAIFIDPAEQGTKIYEAMQKNGFTVEAILLTHAHFDHIMGSLELKEHSSAKIYALEQEKEVCNNVEYNLSTWSGSGYTLEADVYLKDGEVLTIADMKFQVLATPGHTVGSCCYYFEDANLLISGDTLFEESVGRTDFPGGSMSTIVHSIQDKLFVLPDDTMVYPGHGNHTTIGHEKKYNPFAAQ